MRPLFGDVPPQHARAADSDAAPQHHQHHQQQQSSASQQPMTFFLADESSVDSALLQSFSAFAPGRESRKQRAGPTDSAPASPSKSATTSIRPRNDSLSASSSAVSVPDLSGAHEEYEQDHDADNISLASDLLQGDAKPTRASASAGASRPSTPLMLGISGPASAFSGISSRRNSAAVSLSDEIASQVLSMSVELEPEASSAVMDSGSLPQLVMPSIKMPSRRPFTDEGKRMGRLKVLIAGDSGIGKTALIKAIVQTCDAIVHVDPIAPQLGGPLGPRPSPRPKARSKSIKTSSSTSQISEIFASTKPYPEWWSSLDDSRLLKRRKSFGGDTILDRNICFIDTPGYSDGSSSMETITPVIRYVESHFDKVQSSASSDQDLLSMLGGDGGNQVDVVLYLVQSRLKPADIKYLQLLAPLTNIIPLLAQVDTLNSQAITQSKERLRSDLLEAGIRPFSFTTSAALIEAGPTMPYAISSLPGSDHDIMDASLLMSPDYVQPLVSSELPYLVEQMFCENGASWLRHAAAKKYLQWKLADNPSRPRALYRPLTMPAGSPSGSLVATAPRTYALARIADHTQLEERRAQIRLANWASELQRSLAKERARYEALARGERAIWLTERLNECVQDGTLVPAGGAARQERSPSRQRDSMRRKSEFARRNHQGMMSATQHQDPLGLLEVATRLKAHGWIALEVLGSMGVLGGVAFWASRNGWHAQTFGWALDTWSALWNTER